MGRVQLQVLHTTECDVGRAHADVPSWSSGNEPRSGGDTLKSENVGGRPNDMVCHRLLQ